jgi:hypothetical protein
MTIVHECEVAVTHRQDIKINSSQGVTLVKIHEVIRLLILYMRVVNSS